MKNNFIMGTGLICLDIVCEGNITRVTTGGTCANVLSVLSLFDWKVFALKPKFADKCDQFISHNFNALAVNEVNYIESSKLTPRIIEILENKKHSFYTSCPKCNRKILSLPLIDKKNASKLVLDDIDVFYYDRVSEGIRKIVSTVQTNGGISFYEPNTSRNVELLLRDCMNAHIVKFSLKKVPISIANKIKVNSGDNSAKTNLIIGTDGSKGLIFSCKDENGNMSDWINVNSEIFPSIIDTSGAGDWLTAGFILSLFELSNGKTIIKTLKEKQKIYDSLLFGIQLSKLCCKAAGAQGIFYSKELLQELNELHPINNTNVCCELYNEDFFANSQDNICDKCLL